MRADADMSMSMKPATSGILSVSELIHVKPRIIAQLGPLGVSGGACAVFLLILIPLIQYYFGPALYIFKGAIAKRIRRWEYCFRGPSIIKDGFEKSNGEPYEVTTPDTRYVFVSSRKHIEEIDQAPDDVLSLRAASKHMLQPKYTMHGFSWHEKRKVGGVVFERTLRTHLTSNLQSVMPELGRIFGARFDLQQSELPMIKGQKKSKVYPMMKEMVVLVNAHAFFGEELGRNEHFLVSARHFVEQVVLGAEPLRLIPQWLVPIAGGVMSYFLKCDKEVYKAMLPVIEQRLRENDLKNLGHKVLTHMDCIQWTIESLPKQSPWTAERIIWELMAIWFGSVHSISVTATYAIHDLCLHREYLEPLREELDAHYDEFLTTGHGLPLLDSFLKESARMLPVETMSTRRSALKPFMFSDGTKLNVNDWTCTPVSAITANASLYPDPTQFSGFRFADPALFEGKSIAQARATQLTPSLLVDANSTWQMWGTGKMACPGRYYAVSTLKMIVGHVIKNYDCELVNPDAKRVHIWRSTNLPRSDTEVVFKPREY
ncbi:cytochrome P450 [Xylaria venustula]|nr:cytochrome P450 [Xylaria venustula]